MSISRIVPIEKTGRGRTVFDEQISAVELTLRERDRDRFCIWRFEIDIREPSRAWSDNTVHTVCTSSLIPAHVPGSGDESEKRAHTPYSRLARGFRVASAYAPA